MAYSGKTAKGADLHAGRSGERRRAAQLRHRAGAARRRNEPAVDDDPGTITPASDETGAAPAVARSASDHARVHDRLR